MRIAVLGAGTWGTALCGLLADGGHAVALWGRDAATMNDLSRRRENTRYLPGRVLPDDVIITADLARAVAQAELVALALPSAGVRKVADMLVPLLPARALVVCAAKGLEDTTRLTLDRVLAECLPQARVVLLSGPNFAREIARGLPAAAVVASRDQAACHTAQKAITGERFRVYTTDDVVGVAIGGALKNVIAIAAGCSDGLNFGANARAALITRGLAEMGRLVVRMGGDPLTLSGLAGLGDLVLTCTGDLSRNRQVGLALAAGESPAAILARLGQVAEGIATARIADELARELGVEMPITAAVASVLSGQRSAALAVAELLSREARPERG
jgi:glycerol-3-phosphate dehydrogenase (NAD(P)+)